MTETPEKPEDAAMTPEQAEAVARALFKWTPFSFPLAWALTAVQGADTRTCLIVSVAGTLMCLGAALLFKLRGAAAPGDARWIQMILGMLARRR